MIRARWMWRRQDLLGSHGRGLFDESRFVALEAEFGRRNDLEMDLSRMIIRETEKSP